LGLGEKAAEGGVVFKRDNGFARAGVAAGELAQELVEE
jgi:hypothetical protein